MDAAAKKSFEIQAQVRHNAQNFKSAMKDLYAWEKEMKEKEKDLNKLAETATIPDETDGASDNSNNFPVRSYLMEKAAKKQEEQQKNMQNKKEATSNNNKNKQSEVVATPDEKPDEEPDPKAKRRKEANEIKEVGNRHVKFQQFDLAEEEYTRAITLCPDEAVFFLNRALCYLKMERYEDCIEDCDRAIQIDSLAVKAYYRRMQANECLGNYMDALKDCTTALTIEPKNAETKKSLNRINELLRKSQKTSTGPNFSADNENLIEIQPIDKPAYKRSSKPLRRVAIADVVGPKETKTFQNLEISDEDIDKLFNSNCGPFVEVKKKPESTEKEKQKTTQKQTIDNEKIAAQINIPTASSITLAEAVEELSSEKVVSNKNSVNPGKIEETKAQKTDQNLISQKRSLPAAPTSTAQFYTHWKELPDAQKYQYLKSIDLKSFSKILGAGFDSDTLTDILRILRDFYLPNKESATCATLLEISRNEQVAILSLLMSSSDKRVLLEILTSIEDNEVGAKDSLDTIKTNFNLV